MVAGGKAAVFLQEGTSIFICAKARSFAQLPREI